MSLGFEYVSSGAIARDPVVGDGGYMKRCCPRHGFSGVTIDGGGHLLSIFGTISGANVSSGANVVVSSGGTLYVLTGDSVDGAQIGSDGIEELSGGTASNPVVSSGGFAYVFAGGTLNDSVVSSGGQQEVSAGGTASGAMVNGSEAVAFGGRASGDIVGSGGFEFVYAAGAVTGTKVVSGGGSESVLHRAGTASATVVHGRQ